MEDLFSLEALLQDWDADAAWPLAASASASDNTADEARGSASRSSLCRRRQRQELLQLRSETMDLERQLRRLRCGSGTTTVATVATANSTSVWRRIAKHQRELKLESEAENARLRRLVKEQRKATTKLEKALHASRSVQEICEKELHRKTTRPSSVDRGRLETELLTTTQDAVSKALQCGAFTRENIDCERVSLKTDANGRVVLESIYCQVYPFDLKTTTEAAWRCYSSTRIPMADGAYSAKSTPSGQFVGCVEFPLVINGHTTVMWSCYSCGKIYRK